MQLLKVLKKNFGHPENFLVDKGGEFGNDEFKDFSENLNIAVMTTAGESPYNNGLVERRIAAIADPVRREDTNCSLHKALDGLQVQRIHSRIFSVLALISRFLVAI